MVFEISPAVERAAVTAQTRAASRGLGIPGPADWLIGLLADADGQAVRLIERLGFSHASVLALAEGIPTTYTCPPADELYQAARDRAIALCADPSLTTDVLLLTVIETVPELHEKFREQGLSVREMEALLRTDDIGWDQDKFRPDAPELAVSVPIPAVSDRFDSGAARAVDASLNRAREALRVIEDYCRFVGNDRAFTERLKCLRHSLASATATLPAAEMLAARDTPGDVGTAVTAAGEYERGSPHQVAVLNLKRLQESLRSAEEFGKLLAPDFARRVEQIRYESYELERLLILGNDSRARLAEARLYVLLTGEHCRHGLDRTAAEALAGGADVIQLREKGLSDRELLTRAKRLRELTREAGALFVVNDRPDIARLSEADGVHLGQDDLPVAEARRVVGPAALIGASTHDIAQIRQAVRDGADYLGVGPTFPSRTKRFESFPGLTFVREATTETALPSFALGGIDRDNIREVLAAGAVGVAVSAVVAGSDDPRRAAAELRAALEAVARCPDKIRPNPHYPTH